MTRNRFPRLRFLFAISAFFLISGCESIDSGLLSASNALSSPDPVTGKREVLLLSEEQEIAMAEKALAAALDEARQNGHAIDEDTPYFERVNTVFQRLLPVVHRQHLPWELHVIDDGAWNAYTIGGGKVVVQTGLLQGDNGLQSDDELASVLAHEMAHVAARHPTESGSKLKVTQMVDKDLRTDEYTAAFTTNQEDEADRISAIYSALAGYDPEAGVGIWQRQHAKRGSYAGYLTDHPLSDDREASMRTYSAEAIAYYTPGVQRDDVAAVLADNPLFSNPHAMDSTTTEGDENGEDSSGESGLAAMTSTLLNTYSEVLKAKTESYKRENKRYQQAREASSLLLFRNLRMGNAQGGGKGLWGVSINATDQNFAQALARLRYWNGTQVIYEKVITWEPLTARQQYEFGIKLEPIRFTGVTLTADYVLLEEPGSEDNDQEPQ